MVRETPRLLVAFRRSVSVQAFIPPYTVETWNHGDRRDLFRNILSDIVPEFERWSSDVGKTCCLCPVSYLAQDRQRPAPSRNQRRDGSSHLQTTGNSAATKPAPR